MKLYVSALFLLLQNRFALDMVSSVSSQLLSNKWGMILFVIFIRLVLSVA